MSRVGALSWIKTLIGWAFLNSLVIVFEYLRLEIANAKDFLGGSHPRKMTATCSRVAIIKDLFNLFMCKVSFENGIGTTSIQGII